MVEYHYMFVVPKVHPRLPRIKNQSHGFVTFLAAGLGNEDDLFVRNYSGIGKWSNLNWI